MNAPLNEDELGMFIRQQLNAGAAQLRPALTERIFVARQRALQRHARREAQPAVAAVGQSVLSWGRDNLQAFVLALCLLLALGFGNYLMSMERVSELEEVDSALLADDLPIDAYLDRGFDTWLSNPQEP
jgi:hypothetical protein